MTPETKNDLFNLGAIRGNIFLQIATRTEAEAQKILAAISEKDKATLIALREKK